MLWPHLATHELDHHLKGLWPQVHARRICEVLVDILEGPGRSAEKRYYNWWSKGLFASIFYIWPIESRIWNSACRKYLKKLSTAASSPSSLPRSCRVPKRRRLWKHDESADLDKIKFNFCKWINVWKQIFSRSNWQGNIEDLQDTFMFKN